MIDGLRKPSLSPSGTHAECLGEDLGVFAHLCCGMGNELFLRVWRLGLQAHSLPSAVFAAYLTGLHICNPSCWFGMMESYMQYPFMH